MKKEPELTILVADDEPELLGAVCQLIDWQSTGFRLVGRASNGLDALQLVESLQPDFLLTDIRMPFISGIALAEQARVVQPLLQIAFLSGYDDFEYAKAGIENDVVAYLLKPISMAELTEELKKIHAKITRKLEGLTARRSGFEQQQLIVATMLLDTYQQNRVEKNLARLRALGVPANSTDRTRVFALRTSGGSLDMQDILATAEQTVLRSCGCCSFVSDDRGVILAFSEKEIAGTYSMVDEIRSAIWRMWGEEAVIGVSREFSSMLQCQAAYAEAMEALTQAERSGDGIYAADSARNMDFLCARAMQMIEKEYANEKLTLQVVSEELHVSANYLGTNIKKLYGDTFMNLLIRKRMTAAANILKSGDARVAEVARRCGYSDQSYFSYCFKKYYGTTPARMRESAKQEQGS